MKRLLSLLLAAVLLCGCSHHAAPETTAVPTETTTATEAPTEPAPETTAPPSYLDTLLASMTLREKVGQLFIVAPESLSGGGAVTEFTDSLSDALEQYPVGGVILFGDNIVSPDQLTALTASFRSAGGIPLFLAIDEEGGLVARLANKTAFGLPRYKNAASVGARGDSVYALGMGKVIGAYLRQYGFNLDFAPVADVNTNPNNPIIGNRAFSSNPGTAAAMASAFADGLNRMDVIAVYKHFPGHGDTAEDSHHALAISYKTELQMRLCEWLPFLEAGSADMIMVGHIAVPELTGDMTPATLSRHVVTQVLKDDLGFDGLVITDSMSMAAITDAYSPGEAALAALNAGCDLLLMPEDLEDAFNAVLAAVESGDYPESRLDDTLRRILAFKQLHGLLPKG